jgi:hypothetical protein
MNYLNILLIFFMKWICFIIKQNYFKGENEKSPFIFFFKLSTNNILIYSFWIDNYFSESCIVLISLLDGVLLS